MVAQRGYIREMKKYVTFYDLNRGTFVITQREVRENQWGYIEISEGIINKDQVFETKDEAIKSLRGSNYIEID